MAEGDRIPLDVIVPIHGGLSHTRECLDALYANTTSPFHLILCDDTTATIKEGGIHDVDPLDVTSVYIETQVVPRGNVTYLNVSHPFRCGNEFFNLGLRYCETPYVATIMNSVFVEHDWETRALQIMEQYPDIGIIGFKNLFPLDSNNGLAGLIESAGIDFVNQQPIDVGRDHPSHHYNQTGEIYGYNEDGTAKTIKAVQWAFALHRRSAIIGNLQEDHMEGFVGWDDIDNCMVVHSKGWRIIYCGEGVGYHRPRATRGSNKLEHHLMNRKNAEVFFKRWGLWQLYRKENETMNVADRLTPKTKEWLANKVTEKQVLTRLTQECDDQLKQILKQALKELGADGMKYYLEVNPQHNQWELKPILTEGPHGEALAEVKEKVKV